MASPAPPLLRLEGICKSFPGVRALRDVDLTLHAGEALALLGENGAGKSTLIKIISGAHRPDAGSMRLHGVPLHFRDPIASQQAGIAVIYQELNLIPALTVRENLFLGRDKTNGLGLIRRRAEEDAAREIFRRVGFSLPLDLPCGLLTIAEQQMVEIGKALALEARIVVMDEPSAALTEQEVRSLVAIIDGLKREGIGVVYISHRLEEVEAVADRVTILRDGEHVVTGPAKDFDRKRIIESMVGRALDQEFPKETAPLGPVRLEVSGLSRPPRVEGVSFRVRAGEVVGMTGLVGAGRTEAVRMLFGADRPLRGQIRIDGVECEIRSPRAAIARGICLLTEDRKSQGLVLGQSVRHNFGLPNLDRFSRFGLVDQRRESAAFAAFVEQLRIKIPHQGQAAANLSGGNQQKVVLAKWLQRNAGVVIFDEPTRGIDVGAKVEIYQLMNRLAAEGKAILMISSELPEVLGMSDRILVMHEGRIAGEIADPSNASQEDILRFAMGHSGDRGAAA